MAQNRIQWRMFVYSEQMDISEVSMLRHASQDMQIQILRLSLYNDVWLIGAYVSRLSLCHFIYLSVSNIITFFHAAQCWEQDKLT